jgi:membrane fusion protein (multidrug efflux system)
MPRCGLTRGSSPAAGGRIAAPQGAILNRHRLRVAAATMVSLLALLTACGGQDASKQAAPPVMEVFVTEVAVEDVPIVREWVGETRGVADIEIRARVNGYLEAIHFREGGRVKKGQLLYSIDKSELLQELTAAQAQLAAAQTQLAYAESDVARYRPLAEMNAVSQRDLDSAVARHEAAIAQVDAAEAGLRLAEIDLSYSEITAPIAGLIGLSQAKVGDYVGQSPNPVVLNTLSDTDPIHVRFPIGEREYLELSGRHREADREANRKNAKDPRLELLLADGSVHPYKGRIEFIQRNVDASTGTLMLEASFPNPDLVLRPGQYGRVRTVVDVLEDQLLVPQRSVQELQGEYQVWVVKEDGSVELRHVEMGRRVDWRWVVREGLSPGDVVVADGIQRLRAGVKVDARPWEPPVTDTSDTAG